MLKIRTESPVYAVPVTSGDLLDDNFLVTYFDEDGKEKQEPLTIRMEGFDDPLRENNIVPTPKRKYECRVYEGEFGLLTVNEDGTYVYELDMKKCVGRRGTTIFHLRPMTQTERGDLLKKLRTQAQMFANGKEQTPSIDEVAFSRERFKKCVVGWDELQDMNGNNLVYSTELVESIFENSGIIVRHLLALTTVLEETHIKKFETIEKN